MQPRPGPECSSSMPSCSMVSSRWVSGLSTGMRPVSAGSSTSMAANPRKSAACQARTHDVPRCAARAPSSVVPAATAVENTTIIKTGSTSGASVISREAPMPPKAPPASSAPTAVRKRASARSPSSSNASPNGKDGGPARTTGMSAPAATVAASTSTGINRKRPEAVSAWTVPLRNSLARSRYGCRTPAPCRHWIRALIFWMVPVTSGPSNTRKVISRSRSPSDRSPVIIGPPRTAAAPRKGPRARTRCTRECGLCCGREWTARATRCPAGRGGISEFPRGPRPRRHNGYAARLRASRRSPGSPRGGGGKASRKRTGAAWQTRSPCSRTVKWGSSRTPTLARRAAGRANVGVRDEPHFTVRLHGDRVCQAAPVRFRDALPPPPRGDSGDRRDAVRRAAYPLRRRGRGPRGNADLPPRPAGHLVALAVHSRPQHRPHPRVHRVRAGGPLRGAAAVWGGPMMTGERSLGLLLFEMTFLVLLGPLVTGTIQKIKARIQCRQGAGVLQPYRDLAKLFRKGTVQADTASGLFRLIPVLVLAATVAAGALVPVLRAGPSALPLGDALLLLGLVAALFFPIAVDGLGAMDLLLGAGAFAEKILLLAIFLALVESSYAKLRLFRVPQYLGIGFVCALTALALRIL